MALSDKKYTYDKLGQVTGNGIDIAQFPQIRDAIADRMREIYGEDIDLYSSTADGQYINMEALIMNNCYQLISNLYKNINPSSASGRYLDVLCSLTHVNRKHASRSTAQIYVMNTTQSTLTPDSITAIDRNNVEWVWNNPKNISDQNTIKLYPNIPVLLEFSCSMTGPIEAYGTRDANVAEDAANINWEPIDVDFYETNGDIYKTISSDYKIYQLHDAKVGSNEESDASLRSRKNRYLGTNSTTTLSSLEAALYNLEEIEDVYIINNNTSLPILSNDGTVVNPHNVYIVLRYNSYEGTQVELIPDDTVAKTIYSKLTPGVITQGYSGTGGGYNNSYNITLASGLTTTVNWKRCMPSYPFITIEFIINDDYVKTDSEEAIKNQLKKYLSNIRINETLTDYGIMTAMNGADLKPNGFPTFQIKSCTIDGNNSYLAPLTYYWYADFRFDYDSYANPVLIISSGG